MFSTRSTMLALAAAATLLLTDVAPAPAAATAAPSAMATPSRVTYRYVEEIEYHVEPTAWSHLPTGRARWTQRTFRWVPSTLGEGLEKRVSAELLPPFPTRRDDAGRGLHATDRPYWVADSMRPPVAALPTDGRAMRRLLLAALKDGRWDQGARWATRPTARELDAAFVGLALSLLVDAHMTPDQRRALFDALKLSGKPAHRLRDGLGRTGEGLRIPIDASLGAGTFTVIFDQQAAEVRFIGHAVKGGMTTRRTIVTTANVPRLGVRP